MYALALSTSAAAGAATALPFFRLGQLAENIPIQAFGLIVAIGVLIGAGVLRRYAEWHGISDDHIRAVTGWVTITGFIGAHVFDVLAYQWDDFMENPVLLIKIWAGISSYGGFLGGAAGFFFYTWWKRRDMRLYADTVVLGLLVAFSIGRIACTVVSDHVGSAVDPNAWYAGLAMDYPRKLNLGGLAQHYPGTSEFIKAWNLGLVEFLYLVPVNLFVLWLAFRPARQDGTDKKGEPRWVDRHPAGLIIIIVGVAYAPVRFFLDYLRPNETDPRYVGLTFAQWISIVTFLASVAFLVKVLRSGRHAEPVTRTAGEAQRRLKMILKDDPREKLPTKEALAVTAKAGGGKKDPKLATTLPEDDDDSVEAPKSDK